MGIAEDRQGQCTSGSSALVLSECLMTVHQPGTCMNQSRKTLGPMIQAQRLLLYYCISDITMSAVDQMPKRKVIEPHHGDFRVRCSVFPRVHVML